MSDIEPGGGQSPMGAPPPAGPQPPIDRDEPTEEREVPIVGDMVQAVKRTSRFSKEVVATMISLATAAFGVVAALAWNSAITSVFQRYYPQVGQSPIPAARLVALFVYAVVVTLVGVVVIVLMGRLAARINAQPVEFKYPGVPKA
jgi:hypothetical protein